MEKKHNMMSGIKKGTIKRIVKYITKSYKKHMLLVFVCIIFSSVIGVIGSLFLRTLIDSYITPLVGTNNPDFSGLVKMLAIMGGVYAIGALATYLYNRTMAIVSQGVLKNIRNEIFEKMEKLPIKYFDTHPHGDVMSIYTNDVDTLDEMIGRSLPTFISSTITVVAIFAAMIYLSPFLTIAVVVFTIITLAITRRISFNSSKYFVSQQKSIGKIDGYVEEMLNGQKVIKVFTHEEKAKEKFNDINGKLEEDMYKAHKYANILMPIAGNLSNLEYVLIAIIGTSMSLSGVSSITIGTLASFLQLTRSFSQPINQMMNQVNSVIRALAGASRIFDMMDEESEKDEGYVKLVNVKEKENGELVETTEKTGCWAWKHQHHDGTLDYIKLRGHIELEDVSFGYEKGKEVLHDISLYAKPGQKIAFVGATGAGKTTITNLINRFYDIEDGKIRYDGININKIKKSDLRRSLGMVLQDTNLFTGTIKENIRYGNDKATDDEVIEAAKLANAHEFISMLPNGYDTKLEANGSKLSQGQRQLICIARAALLDPPVMILDEATSSIDTRTEKIVQDGMDKLMEGRTVFVIAHRLSTVRNSKAIMVLDHGKIIERGNHEQLMEEKGQYYQLYTGAFELE